MKKIALIAASLFMLCQSAAYAEDDTQLVVINNWTKTVQVKEGRIITKEDKVNPGRVLTWNMFSGTIAKLKINYYKDGKWKIIPGCPNGDYASGLKIKVLPSYNDPNMPRCEID